MSFLLYNIYLFILFYLFIFSLSLQLECIVGHHIQCEHMMLLNLSVCCSTVSCYNLHIGLWQEITCENIFFLQGLFVYDAEVDFCI
jgi:hypothetical protein